MNYNVVGGVNKWYQTWWGVMLAGLAFTIVAGIFIIGIVAGHYWWQIKHGQGDNLRNQFYSQNQESEATKLTRAELEDKTAPYLGSANAKVVIVEFLDFKCPNCRAASPILKQLIAKHGSEVKFITRDFPIESAHPGANQLAVMARCAITQGLYWPLHDWLFSNQDSLGESLDETQIKNIADNFGLDFAKLQTCLNSTAAKIQVNKDYAVGFKYGVNKGTPTFFVNGQKVEGVLPLDVWEKIIAQY